MTRRSWQSPDKRKQVRRQGFEDARRHAPMFALPRVAHPAQRSRAELREEAERAAAEWRRRYDPSDLNLDG